MTIEQLLNKLIEKGWRPYEDRYVKCAKFGYSVHFIVRPIVNFVLEGYAEATVPLKEILTSKESGFRQFVCENDYWVHKDTYLVEKYTDHTAIHLYQCNDYRYWLLGSSLKDKSELEDFLLNSIKLD